MPNYNNPQYPVPRVFVSSVIEDFQAYREAARQAIAGVGGEPILINEDFPSLAKSSRNTCLDAVESADIFIIIIGARSGWDAPSGKLVIEEEYDQAQAKKLPVLVFLQDAKRDSRAQEFAERLSEYIDGLFRVTFTSPADLQAKIEKALTPFFSQTKGKTMDKASFTQFLRNPHLIPNETSMRFVLVPEREEEVIDPIVLGSEDFAQHVYEIGHSQGVRLFNYSRQKEHGIKGQSLIIHQFDPSGSSKETVDEVRLEISGLGQIIIDANVTRRVSRGQEGSPLDIFVVAHEDIEIVINASFRFTGMLFDYLDRFKRYQRFFYNIALVNLGMRRLVEEPKEQESYQMNTLNQEEPMLAFNEARLVDWSDLNIPKNEIERVLTVLPRRVGEQNSF